jgi:predicted transcriptional regulator
MADEADRCVALFSIHPRFADAILRGEKRVEFRRRGPSRDTAFVIVYATSPVKRVVGWFRVGGIEAEAPRALWARFGGVGGVELDEFDRYYEGRDVGTAITVAEPAALTEPLQLSSVAGLTNPPQSFQYVSWKVFEDLRAWPVEPNLATPWRPTEVVA